MRQIFSHISKDAQKNFTSFDTDPVLGGDGTNMVLNKKPTKNGNYVGLGKSNKYP